MPETLTRILGYASDEDKAEQLHHLQHCSAVDQIVLPREDTQRHRLRVHSQTNREYLIALPRDQHLSDGAVLVLESDRAVVVKMAEEQWLRLLPGSLADAVELGYFAGNLHWRVKFHGAELHVALEGPESSYLNRLQPFLDAKRVQCLHG
ncbi:MAG: urease accessory protein UreE [Gammaproteobacteria bacterium]|nr:urease accessory protein UreE [Gammaproteobacteria bacterium]